MFEVGISYRVVTLETGLNDEGSPMTFETTNPYEVAEVDGALVKFLGPDWSKENFDDLLPTGDYKNKPRDEIIMNTASLFFVRAEKIVTP